MDNSVHSLDYSDMPGVSAVSQAAPFPDDCIPSWSLYGEDRLFPDMLHVERIRDRAAGLDWFIAPHRHPHLHQFLLLTSGDAEIAIDGETHAPPTPVLLSVPSGTVHGFRFSTGTKGFVVTVPVVNLPELLGPGTEEGRRLRAARLVSPPPGFKDLFERLRAEHRAHRPARAAMLMAEITRIACEVLRSAPPPAGGEAGAMDARVARFLDTIAMSGTARRSVEDHAADLGITSRHFTRLCVAAVGATPGVLIEAATMREARRLLAYTRAPVAAIGCELGFEDAAYFSRAFRRHAGLSPRDYRRKIDGAPSPSPRYDRRLVSRPSIGAS